MKLISKERVYTGNPCQWVKMDDCGALMRCTNTACARLITDEDSKDLCGPHTKEYQKRYCDGQD